MIEPINEVINSCANAVSQTTSALAKISEIKRTTGISKRQANRLMNEMETNKQLAESFAKMCELYPGLKFEMQIGNMKLSNISEIINKAQMEFEPDEFIPDNRLDDEWLHKFLDIAGEVSEAQKQSILAKVLAGKLRKPDSISYRTLRILKDLSKKDIELFRKALSCSFGYPDAYRLIPRKNGTTTYVSLADIMALDECGLMDSSSDKTMSFNDAISLMSCNNLYLLHISCNKESGGSIDCYYFTDSALELMPYIEKEEADLDTIKSYIDFCVGKDKTVSLHKYWKKEENLIYFFEQNLLE